MVMDIPSSTRYIHASTGGTSISKGTDDEHEPGILVVSEAEGQTYTLANGTHAFAVEPYTPGQIRFQLLGGVINGAVVLGGLAWIAATWSDQPPSWPWVLLAVLAGIYTADLGSGLLHWAFDTWFDENNAFLRRMVLQVREHHIYPNRIFHTRFLNEAGTLSWFAMLPTAPITLWAVFFSSGPAAAYTVLSAVIFDVLLACMLASHKCGHRIRQPLWIRLLQKSGILLSVHHHSQHHLGNHDYNYCIVNGWADRTLGRLGFFRGLEWMISRLTGAKPQRNDHEWQRRFGRKVVGRQA
jgi:ubiquitin-conjugating enzyme E2 variant